MKKATIALALLILSSIDMSMAKETEIRSINEGATFELKCATHLQYPVVWYHQTHEILLGGEVPMTFQTMFHLTGNQLLGEYNLHIPSADGRYVGNYRCVDDEGQGSELQSIQINIIDPEKFSIAASASATDMVPIAKPAMLVYREAPKAEASINIPAVVGGIVAFVVIVVFVVIIVVARRKWPTKHEGKSGSICHRDAEAQQPYNPDASETLSPTKTSPGLVMEHAVDSITEEHDFVDPNFPQNPIAKRPTYNTQPSVVSTSSRSPLINDDGEGTPEI